MFKSVKNLKDWYVILLETGFILTLLIFLLAFKVKIHANETVYIPQGNQEIPNLIDIPITPPDDPPAPMKPSVVNVVPDDKIIEESLSDLDIAWEPEDYISPPKKTEKPDDEVMFFAVEEKPSMIGGYKSLYERIEYPKKARLAGIEGKVIVEFVVDKDGKVRQAKVIRGIGGGCDEEALEAVKRLTFHPGKQRGIAVPVRMSIPVTFRLKN